jgi:hypothetical protein
MTITDNYSLDQNYPNPFNPATKITYSIPEGKNVKLTVYDMLGKEVTTLVNEYKASGSYTVPFNGSSLPSGIYIYTLQAGQFRDSKKLLLLK